MALIECKECKNEVSEKAKFCPHCGARIRKPRSLKIILFIFVCICIFVVLAIVGYREEGLYNYNEGVKFQQTGQIELAEQQFKLALEKNPKLAEAHLNLGMIYIDRGWYEGGEKSTLQAIKIFEQTKETFIEGSTWKQPLSIAYNNLGVIEIARGINKESDFDYLKGKTYWEKAMSFFHKAVELDPSNSNAQGNINRFKDAY